MSAAPAWRGHNSIPERSELLNGIKTKSRIGDPPGVQAHHPLHERRCRPWSCASTADDSATLREHNPPR